MLFDKSQAVCDKPVPAPLPERIVVENGRHAYDTWLYPDASASPGSQQLALRLRTPTHQYHYVRVPIPFPVPWTGWPSSIQFNVTQDMVDVLAGDPTDGLLCPKLWRTSAGSGSQPALSARACPAEWLEKAGCFESGAAAQGRWFRPNLS